MGRFPFPPESLPRRLGDGWTLGISSNVVRCGLDWSLSSPPRDRLSERVLFDFTAAGASEPQIFLAPDIRSVDAVDYDCFAPFTMFSFFFVLNLLGRCVLGHFHLPSLRRIGTGRRGREVIYFFLLTNHSPIS